MDESSSRANLLGDDDQVGRHIPHLGVELEATNPRHLAHRVVLIPLL